MLNQSKSHQKGPKHSPKCNKSPQNIKTRADQNRTSEHHENCTKKTSKQSRNHKLSSEKGLANHKDTKNAKKQNYPNINSTKSDLPSINHHQVSFKVQTTRKQNSTAPEVKCCTKSCNPSTKQSKMKSI